MQKENEGATAEELKQLIGEHKPRLGMFEGDTENGMIEVGQNISLINNIQTVQEIVNELIDEFKKARENLMNL